MTTITKLTIPLMLPKGMRTNNLGSVLHGVLMELFSEETTEFLHESSHYRPLKQRLIFDKKDVKWEIVSLDEAIGEELTQLISSQRKIILKKHKIDVPISEYKVEKIAVEELLQTYFKNEILSRYVKINILSPTSIKSHGNYDIFPDVTKFFRSIMLNFDTFNSEIKTFDHETLDYLTENVSITDYKLRSSKFHLEKVRIPGFSGEIVFRINGSKQFLQLVHFLLAYGEYSGVGIKTTLGMGKFKVMSK